MTGVATGRSYTIPDARFFTARLLSVFITSLGINRTTPGTISNTLGNPGILRDAFGFTKYEVPGVLRTLIHRDVQWGFPMAEAERLMNNGKLLHALTRHVGDESICPGYERHKKPPGIALYVLGK